MALDSTYGDIMDVWGVSNIAAWTIPTEQNTDTAV